MHILDVQIADHSMVTETGVHRATLMLKTLDGGISLRAMTELPGSPAPQMVRHHLMADAMRQLKRLPEYRSGAKTITLAKDARNDMPEGA